MKYNKKIFFIGEKLEVDNHAGSKARTDINNILNKLKYNLIENIENKRFNLKIKKIFFLLKLSNLNKLYKIITLRKKFLIIQYPFYFNFIINWVLYFILKRNFNKYILFIHDIDTIRDVSNKNIKNEINIFNNMYAIIVHNEKMKDFLIDNGVKTKIIVLELFDYLLNKEYPNRDYKLGKSVAFAGNLAKSEFLQREEIKDLNIKFNLYGPNFNSKNIKGKNIKYNGSYGPEVIPYEIEGSFGLIWDGISLNECAGSFGNYLKVNNPHKLSLYIAAGLPVITWKKAAIADFIKKYDIGFTVDSLYDIEKIISSMDNKQYETYVQNVKKIQEKVCAGYFTKRALDEVEKLLEFNK